jgi:hypothetical protein
MATLNEVYDSMCKVIEELIKRSDEVCSDKDKKRWVHLQERINILQKIMDKNSKNRKPA